MIRTDCSCRVSSHPNNVPRLSRPKNRQGYQSSGWYRCTKASTHAVIARELTSLSPPSPLWLHLARVPVPHELAVRIVPFARTHRGTTFPVFSPRPHLSPCLGRGSLRGAPPPASHLPPLTSPRVSWRRSRDPSHFPAVRRQSRFSVEPVSSISQNPSGPGNFHLSERGALKLSSRRTFRDVCVLHPPSSLAMPSPQDTGTIMPASVLPAYFLGTPVLPRVPREQSHVSPACTNTEPLIPT